MLHDPLAHWRALLTYARESAREKAFQAEARRGAAEAAFLASPSDLATAREAFRRAHAEECRWRDEAAGYDEDLEMCAAH